MAKKSQLGLLEETTCSVFARREGTVLMNIFFPKEMIFLPSFEPQSQCYPGCLGIEGVPHSPWGVTLAQRHLLKLLRTAVLAEGVQMQQPTTKGQGLGRMSFSHLVGCMQRTLASRPLHSLSQCLLSTYCVLATGMRPGY